MLSNLLNELAKILRAPLALAQFVARLLNQAKQVVVNVFIVLFNRFN